MLKNGNTKGARGRAAERRLQAFALFKSGATYRQIGRELGVSEAQAWHDVKAVMTHLDEMEIHAGKEYRRVILERDRGLIRAAYPKALAGDLEAARLVVLVHKELRELLGLDAPKVERHDTMPVTDEVTQVLRELQVQEALRPFRPLLRRVIAQLESGVAMDATTARAIAQLDRGDAIDATTASASDGR